MKTKLKILTLFVFATIILLSFTVSTSKKAKTAVTPKTELNSSDALIMEDRNQWN